MSNLDLAVIIAMFAQRLASLIVWAVIYAAGDPRTDKRQRAIDKINEIASDIDEKCKAIGDLAKGDANDAAEMERA